MIRTVVCNKDGCSGNTFDIKTIDNRIDAECRECKETYIYELGDGGYKFLSTCSNCGNDAFKLFIDTDKNNIFAKCMECGEPPEKILVDADGIQISYTEKLLGDIKEVLGSLDQRICNVEIKLEDMERGQNILEESLAYINKYIIESR